MDNRLRCSGHPGVALLGAATIRRIPRGTATNAAALMLIAFTIAGCSTTWRDESLFTLYADTPPGPPQMLDFDFIVPCADGLLEAVPRVPPEQLRHLGRRAALADRRLDRFVLLHDEPAAQFYFCCWPPFPYPREEVMRDHYGIVIRKAISTDFAAGYNSESKRFIEQRYGPDIWKHIRRDTHELFLERLEDLPVDFHPRRVAMVVDASAQMTPFWSSVAKEFEKTIHEEEIHQTLTLTIARGENVERVIDLPYRYMTPHRKQRAISGVCDPHLAPSGTPDLRPAIEVALQQKPEILYILTHDPVAHDDQPGAADRTIDFIRQHIPPDAKTPKIVLLLWGDSDDTNARKIVDAFGGLIKHADK